MTQLVCDKIPRLFKELEGLRWLQLQSKFQTLSVTLAPFLGRHFFALIAVECGRRLGGLRCQAANDVDMRLF